MEAGFDATEVQRAGFDTRAAWDAFRKSEPDGFDAYQAGFTFEELQEHGILRHPTDAYSWGFPSTPEVLRAIEQAGNPLEA